MTGSPVRAPSPARAGAVGSGPVRDGARDASVADTVALPAGLSAKDTFEHWRLAVASLFEANTERADDRESFRGSLVTHNVGRFLIGASSSTPLLTGRDEALIGRVGVDHVLFQLYVSGGGRIEAEGVEAEVRAGDLVCLDLSRRHAAALADLDTISMVVPRALVHLPPRAIERAHGGVIDGRSPIGLLLAQQLTALSQVAGRMTAADLDPATTIASSLVSVGLSTAGRGEVEDAGAMLALTLRSVRSHIETRLGDADLSAETIGRRFGLSRSALYRLFEPLGGIAQYIRERRLTRAALHAGSVGSGRGAVARLAAICGFSSEAAFSRAFRARHGVTPREAIVGARLRLGEAGPVEMERNWMQGWLEEL